MQCPSGTSLQPDGTCMMRGSHFGSSTPRFVGSTPISTRFYTSFGSSSFPSTRSHTSSFSGNYVPCPPGTVQQPDQSCLVSNTGFGTPITQSTPIYGNAPTYGYPSSNVPYNNEAAYPAPTAVIFIGSLPPQSR
ncbi:MAG: hypothetical protein AAFP97_00510 [Pseudomonadota bacterium]